VIDRSPIPASSTAPPPALQAGGHRFDPGWLHSVSGNRRALVAASVSRLPKVTVAALVLAIATLAATYPADALAPHSTGRLTGMPATKRQPVPATRASDASAPRLSLAKQVGQLIIATYQGQTPPASLLTAIRLGHVGAVILMGDNTTGGPRATKLATAQMQTAARQGANAGLLIMTDQEGGTVKRLSGPPQYAAIDMANPTTAYTQGRATGELLRSAGVNVDLAPVADVIRVHGFIAQQGRSFGTNPAVVSNAACKFAAGLAGAGVAYTLKHFPGLGDAIATTDLHAVSVTESASNLYEDDAAYRRCGHGPLALVMISSASYSHMTGSVPAVMDPKIYSQVLARDGVTALPISDDFESGAIKAVSTQGPAKTAINAGLDMVMYAAYESVALSAYTTLLADAHDGALSRNRVQAAADRVLQLKNHLGLGIGNG
jgi:beta-N-acetylhexosaminidase